MIRIAATADVHFGRDSAGTMRPQLEHLSERADLLLIAGDLTRCGEPEEAKVLADELRDVEVPTIAVLGNHDYHSDRPDEIRELLCDQGVLVLEGESHLLDVDGRRVAVTGAKGFGGGFAGACGTDFGEPEMKAFIGHTKDIAARVESLLREDGADVRIALLHYSPVEETLRGERLEIYPFLGSYLLAEAVDRAGADLVLHGHAHNGTEKGVTPGGVPVRNVAQPVIRFAYGVYGINGDGDRIVDDRHGYTVRQEIEKEEQWSA
ncbi:MAG TPA: metallophosphoesterase [Actinomycetota bacterium]|jgi:Icc-related predicted phosphoesterase|nr:metallophosphoesterase [Actinomycetota bacterium]